MNLSKHISLLKDIDTVLNDNVYLGITENKTLLSEIKTNTNTTNSLLTTIDGVLDSVAGDTFFLPSADSKLGDIKTSTTEMNTTLSNQYDLGVTWVSLAWNGGTSLGSGNYKPPNREYASYRNTVRGDDIYLDSICISINTDNQMTSFLWDDVFDGNVNGSSTNFEIVVGTGNTSNEIDNEIFDFNRNWKLFPHYKQTIGIGSSQYVHQFEWTNLNHRVVDNDYIIASCSLDLSYTGFNNLHILAGYRG